MLADEKGQKGKSGQYGVQLHNKSRKANILKLHTMLDSKKYVTSEYDIFQVYEPKERTVYRLPYFPDRIVHHAIMNVLEPILIFSRPPGGRLFIVSVVPLFLVSSVLAMTVSSVLQAMMPRKNRINGSRKSAGFLMV